MKIKKIGLVVLQYGLAMFGLIQMFAEGFGLALICILLAYATGGVRQSNYLQNSEK